MRTKEEIAEYQRKYRKLNYARLRKYKTLWKKTDYHRRKGKDVPKIHLWEIDGEATGVVGREWSIGSHKCQNCEILLKSKFAGKGNEKYCEECLKR